MLERSGQWLVREAVAWWRAVRGVAAGIVLVALALAVLRFAGPRGLLVVAVVGTLIWWLARLGGGRERAARRTGRADRARRPGRDAGA